MAANPYAPWPNGPPGSPQFFPICVWWQNPALAGKSGTYPTIAAAAAGMGINIFLGVGNWPERFGGDDGELEAIKKYHRYVVGGINTPWQENTSPQSVASVLALAQSLGAGSSVIGYNAGDEPSCEKGTMQTVPAVIKGIEGFDNTRIVTFNQTTWMITPQWMKTCEDAALSALQAISVGSFDFYPLTGPWFPQVFKYPKSNFLDVPNDSLWVQGLATAALRHDGRPGQPMWVFIEAGGDNLGFSGGNNSFPGGVSAGSRILSNESGWSIFTASWVGLMVSGDGIAAGTRIVAVLDATHVLLSKPAIGTSNRENIIVTGGAGSHTDCVAQVNLCVVNGNEYRPTAAQVNAETWMSLINGADGIEYFCHDSSSDFFCMGDVAGGAVAAATQANLTYVSHTVLGFARVLNAPTAGLCSMQQMNYTTGEQSTTTSCSDGNLTIRTANAAVPAMGLLKQVGSVTYLFAQSDRRSPSGSAFTFLLTGLGGKLAKVVYDSNERYDPAHSRHGAAFQLDMTGSFTDVLGEHGDDYQVKVYMVQ